MVSATNSKESKIQSTVLPDTNAQETGDTVGYPAAGDGIAGCQSDVSQNANTNLEALYKRMFQLLEHVYKMDGNHVELCCLTSEERLVELLKVCDKALDEDSDVVRELARKLAGYQHTEYADTKAAAIFAIASMLHYVQLGIARRMTLLGFFAAHINLSAERIAAGIADDAVLDCFTLFAIMGAAQRPLTIFAGEPVTLSFADTNSARPDDLR
ncbi:hypothetical protein BDR26DRAFT_866875 [Obelidium mucronatum]|nr:hypothetical protein BDR26DRAFT_866875 [Obelidium mucronatum]